MGYVLKVLCFLLFLKKIMSKNVWSRISGLISKLILKPMFRSWKEVFKTRSMCHCYIIKGSFSLWSNEISIWKGGSLFLHDMCFVMTHVHASQFLFSFSLSLLIYWVSILNLTFENIRLKPLGVKHNPSLS